jgi:hypothetical protein
MVWLSENLEDWTLCAELEKVEQMEKQKMEG